MIKFLDLKILAILLLLQTNLFAQEGPLVVSRKEKTTTTKLSSYKPNYFLMGDNAKFQISFKVQALKNSSLFFGYGQKAIWDILDESSPFQDMDFNPELFYRFNLNFLNYSYLDIGLFEHNSNGKSGTESRSFNQSYLRISSEKEYNDSFSFLIENKFYIIYSEDEPNEDIPDYLGFYRLKLALRNLLPFAFDDEEVYFVYLPGRKLFNFTDDNYGSINVGLKFRFQESQILPTFMIDYFSGYSETLLNYRIKDKKIRAGIVLNW